MGESGSSPEPPRSMLVYGDSEFEESSSALISRLEARLNETCAEDLDGLRTVLIQAGQLEQAVTDWSEAHPAAADIELRECVACLTDQLASAFHHVWRVSALPGTACLTLRRELKEVRRWLTALRRFEDRRVLVRIPEGFEFYALFPEQYCEAAIEWARAHGEVRSKRVLVVGIRSIGTTLSALVAVSLEFAGWHAQRLTVRPAGHPYSRTVEIRAGSLDGFKHALIVDEGPGISGSSMAATGLALREAGLNQLSILPGHAGEPLSPHPETGRWWRDTPRFFVPVERLRWDGMSLETALLSRACSLHGRLAAGGVADLSAGQWRQMVFRGEHLWPEVAAGLERAKYLCKTQAGSVLWKFAGFNCARRSGSLEYACQRLKTLANQSLSPPCLGVLRGFSATEWIPGRRLTRAAGTQSGVLQHVAAYIGKAAGLALSPGQAGDARRRLERMLVYNTEQGLGAESAERIGNWIGTSDISLPALPSYGDGRMAPHEWVLTPDGRLVKTDCTGHDEDHTLVGPQSVLWDIAGTLVEWDLRRVHRGLFMQAIRKQIVSTDDRQLCFHEMAYAAFRLGVCTLFAAHEPQYSAERRRLEAARSHYSARLSALIRGLPRWLC